MREGGCLTRQCLSQPRVDLLRGLLLHAGHHVAVRVQSDADGGVTEPLGDGLRDGYGARWRGSRRRT